MQVLHVIRSGLMVDLLPVELPLNIYNTNATYETQFGWIQRPTHKNTNMEAAKFEVCGHKVMKTI